ncbi:MAG: hypothetical protein Q8P11_03995 [bacterium]|nr:hypothetical protein [bacterium]
MIFSRTLKTKKVTKKYVIRYQCFDDRLCEITEDFVVRHEGVESCKELPCAGGVKEIAVPTHQSVQDFILCHFRIVINGIRKKDPDAEIIVYLFNHTDCHYYRNHPNYAVFETYEEEIETHIQHLFIAAEIVTLTFNVRVVPVLVRLEDSVEFEVIAIPEFAYV